MDKNVIILTPDQLAHLIEILNLDPTTDIKTINNQTIIINYDD